MYGFQSSLPETLYQEVHHGKFADSLSTQYHQFVGIKERSFDFFALDESNPKLTAFKICEKEIHFKILSSQIFHRGQFGSHATGNDLVVLSLENNTLVLLEYNRNKGDFEICSYLELSAYNRERMPLEKTGDRIKVAGDLILISSYFNRIDIVKFENFPPNLTAKPSIETGEFISDLDYCPATSTLHVLCHKQGDNGQIDMHIQFYNKDKDGFKFETSLERTDLIPENISYKILSSSADKCFTVSPVDGLVEWNTFSLKKEVSHKIGLETVINVFAVNNLLLLFLDDNSCLYFEKGTNPLNATRIKISTNQKPINWSVYSTNSGLIYAFLNGQTGIEFFKFRVSDGEIQRVECILKQNLFSNVVDAQVQAKSPFDKNILSLSLKPESVDLNIWDSLSVTYQGGQLINIINQSCKLPITPTKSWLLSNSPKRFLLQSFEEIFVLSFSGLLEKDFTINFQAFSEVFADCQTPKNLIDVFHISEEYSVLITSSEVLLLNIKTFQTKQLDFSGKIEQATYFSNGQNAYILTSSLGYVSCYQLNNGSLSLLAKISIGLQVSLLYCFKFGTKEYLLTGDYEGLLTFYDLETQQKVHEIQTDYVFGCAIVEDNKLILGDRTGNVVIYSLHNQQTSVSTTLEASHCLGEQKISLLPTNDPKGLFISSGVDLFFLSTNGGALNPYPVKYRQPFNIGSMHILEEQGPHIFVINKDEVVFFLADLQYKYRKVDFPLDNSLDNFKILKNEPDHFRRVLIDESSSTIHLVTRNLNVLICDKQGKILSSRALPNKKNTNHSFLVNARISSLNLQEKQVSVYVVSFKNSNNFYLNLYALEDSSDLNSDLASPSMRIRKLGVSDITATDTITDAVLIPQENVLVASIGPSLFLYSIEPREKDDEIGVVFKQKESKVFRYNFTQLEFHEDFLIATDQNYGVNVFKLKKAPLGESLGFKWHFDLLCVISNKMPCDSLFLSKDEYMVINKFGELLIRSNKNVDSFSHCLEYCTGTIGDMCRKMLKLTDSQDRPEVLIPGLKGGLFKVVKTSKNFEKKMFDILKFVENSYKEILLFGNPLENERRSLSGQSGTMLDLSIWKMLVQEPEQMRNRSLKTCFSLLPESEGIYFHRVVQFVEKLCI